MTLRLTQLHFAAVAMAIAAVSLSGASARAFTMENLGTTNADGSSRYADPDNQVKNFGQGAQPFGQNGPLVQFGAGPYTRYPGSLNSSPPPQPYAQPLGNGD